MNIKGFKRMLFGEKMPDKDDPQYKERYEREVQAGHKFAKATRIDQAAAKVQGFANAHRTLFLVIVFTFVIGAFAWNAYRLVTVYSTVRQVARQRKCRILYFGNGTNCCRKSK